MVGQASMPRAMAVSGSRSNNFARMMASSRLATHTPAVPQVYTAPDAHLARGDFGFKRPLPSRDRPVGALRYVAVDAIDTQEGQTSWDEREHQVLLARRFRELNVRLWNPNDSRTRNERLTAMSPIQPDQRGILGPRISTTYDPSTRRSVPTTYNSVKEEETRTHLQNEARLGRGPVYHTDMHTGELVARGLDREGPFGRASRSYTHTVSLPLEYRDMDERTFERYLEHIRSQRSQYLERSSYRAARDARGEVARKYAMQRERAALAPRDDDAPVTAAAAVVEGDLPLPPTTAGEADAIETDLWDESRCDKSNGGIWRPWLQWQDEVRSAKSDDERLPHVPSPKSGEAHNAPMHPQGGLQYGHPDAIQTQLLADAVPARLLERSVDEFQFQKTAAMQRNRNLQQYGAHVAVGGRMAFMNQRSGPTNRFIDWSQRDPNKGVLAVKPTNATYSVGSSYSAPLPVWGSDDKRYSSAEGTMRILQRNRSKSRVRKFASDQLKNNNLTPQFGTINMSLRAVTEADRNLARGRPGSGDWVGAIDGSAGYRPGDLESAPMNFTSLNMANSARLGGSQGVGAGMYSKREQDALARQRARLASEGGNRNKAAYNASGGPQRHHIEAMINSVQRGPSSSRSKHRTPSAGEGARREAGGGGGGGGGSNSRSS